MFSFSDETKAKLKNRVVWSRLLGWVLLCYATGLYGGVVTAPAIPEWYAGLTKPFFSPPNWLFAPVWTTLYALIAIAIWVAIEFDRSGTNKGQKLRLQLLFVFQMLLNGLWSLSFFGLKSPLLALGILGILLLTGIVTLRIFAIRRPLAAWLFLPYLLWLGFAGLLNAAIVSLN
ncbi:tryptophan-rich sensory protein [Pseudovibrio exalbescens]|uniref:TspO/MBR family protein n=1 Tax=Pseudovibrio exalbescens TaxID=197461 RepID=UPI00236598F3|nr:TspO/MBR family protein [Pseudovibrio exalbescens]MDD7909489.1 tryptophan-rich sensory protein [Pseudovibrio exalbescens]